MISELWLIFPLYKLVTWLYKLVKNLLGYNNDKPRTQCRLETVPKETAGYGLNSLDFCIIGKKR